MPSANSLIWLALLPACAFALGPRIVGQRDAAVAAIDCSFEVTAAPGDTCNSFLDEWCLTLPEFQALNPTLKSCPNLTAGQKYCVLGGATPTATPPSPPATTAKPTTASSSAPAKPTSTTSAPGFEPTQPGLVSNCNGFYLVKAGDTCEKVAGTYLIALPDFYKWNPSIGAGCTNMWADYYVCVSVPGATHPSPSPSPTPIPGPQPQMPNIVSTCRRYYQVNAGDSCYAIQQANGITLDQIRRWNPEVNAGCTNLWLGYYICIGA
ncbi:LysM domain-containing protein [Podospora didyma]|uniref:LysM domain-containing protein n=1 Tax=Podospora didyma TaxID=330526 RepID=A0AAE0P8Q7_9PEZI|nr:LysM domain-containing protein [Podospora didyma]